MKGVELIAQERNKQITKHNRTVEMDVQLNKQFQLSEAASILCSEGWGCNNEDDMIEDHCPAGWDKEIWGKMIQKSYEDRLVIAGALIAAELDRLAADK